MKARLDKLERKRAQLMERAALQRVQLAVQFRQWEHPLTIADKGLAMLRLVRAHPLLFAIGGGLAARFIGKRWGGARRLNPRWLGALRLLRSWLL